MGVPLIENGEHNKPGADYFVKEYMDQILAQSPNIDTILLACTHYPLMQDKIQAYLPKHIQTVAQGDIVAKKLDRLPATPSRDGAKHHSKRHPAVLHHHR